MLCYAGRGTMQFFMSDCFYIEVRCAIAKEKLLQDIKEIVL